MDSLTAAKAFAHLHHVERGRQMYGVLPYTHHLEAVERVLRKVGVSDVEARRSFDIALQKVCTSITSGWFREFGWENFDRVEAMYEPDYVDRFWKAVDDGRVRKLEPGESATPY